MSLGLLGGVAIAYCWVALSYARAHRWGMAIAFTAYAVSNIGFMVDLWKTR